MSGRAPPWPCLRDQQERPAFQGASGLITGETPRAVLWDLGGVLVRWNPRTLYSKIFTNRSEMERFLRVVCTMDWHGRHDSGEPMADTAQDLKARHPQYSDEIDAWRLRWPEMFSGPDDGAVTLVEALSVRGVPQHALTNFPGEKWEAFAADPDYGFLKHFKTITVSGQIGTRKPARDAFAHAEGMSGLKSGEMAFFDDTAPNVQAAREIGYHAHLFNGAAGAERVLKDYGLL